MRVRTGEGMSINGGKQEPVPGVFVCPCSITGSRKDSLPACRQFLAGAHAGQNPHTAYPGPEKTVMTGCHLMTQTGYRPVEAESHRSGSG